MAVTYDMMKSTTRDALRAGVEADPGKFQAGADRGGRDRNLGVVPARRWNSCWRRPTGPRRRTPSSVRTPASRPISSRSAPGCSSTATSKQAFVDGFDELVETIEPPILKFVTNPLTNARSYRGKDMPIVSYDLLIAVQTTWTSPVLPRRWVRAAGRRSRFSAFPTLEEIENYIMECVLKAGSQHCPPVVIGVGIGGSFDQATKMAKQATLRPFGRPIPRPILADMEAACSRRSTKPASARWAPAARLPRSACISTIPPATASRRSRSVSTAGSTAALAPGFTIRGKIDDRLNEASP